MISIIFDTETTGLPIPGPVPVEKQPRIIEVACVVCDKGVIVKQYSSFVFPAMKVPAIITKITGITDADVEKAPTWNTILPEVAGYFAQAEVAIAHNLDFDYKLINFDSLRAGNTAFPWPPRLICSMLAYEHIKGKWMKQGEMYEYFLKKPQAKAHRALDDVLALHECLTAANFFEELEQSNEVSTR